MKIEVLAVGEGTIDDSRRPELPDGIGYRLVSDHGDSMTVEVSDEAEAWAVEQGYHTPTRVTSGRFQLALKAKDPQVYAAVRQMIDSDEDLALAAGEPYFNRNAATIAGLQQHLQASGFDQVTDEWVDELFREAYLLEL